MNILKSASGNEKWPNAPSLAARQAAGAKRSQAKTIKTPSTMKYENPEIILKTHLGQTYLTLEYDPVNHWGYSNWLWKDDYGQNYVKEGCEAMLLFVEKYRFDRWLNDNRLVEGTWDEVNEWIASSWLPRRLALGVRHYSVINSPDLYSSLSSEFMEESVNFLGLNMRNWGDQANAAEWLRKQEPAKA